MTQTLLDKPVDPSIPAVIGLAKLAKMAFDNLDLTPIMLQLADRLAHNNDVAALMDLCLLDQMRNSAERALTLQADALNVCRLYQLPAKTSSARLKLLGFAAAGAINANTPIEFLIEDADITLYLLYVVPGLPAPPIPEHDLAFVLAAESEKSRTALHEIERLVADWPRPVVNPPGLIPQLGRERLYRLAAPISGVEIPATVRVDRATWEDVGRGEVAIETILLDGGFPLIARPLDSHGGQGLEKLDRAADVEDYLSRRPEAEFFLSRFVDYRSSDGLYRKYRIAVIEGKPFPSHLAVSDHWMVHYLNAGMVESAAKRAEEAHFMDRFEEGFAHRHGRAIAEMASLTQLDYFGLDCGETPDGKLLVFEADTALVVHNMDPADLFPYKGPHMLALFEAFRAMLYRRGGVG